MELFSIKIRCTFQLVSTWKLFPTRTNQVKLGKIRLFGVVRIVFSVMTNMPTYILSTTFNSDIPLHRQSFSRGSTVLLFYKPSEAGHQGTFEDGLHKLQN